MCTTLIPKTQAVQTERAPVGAVGPAAPRCRVWHPSWVSPIPPSYSYPARRSLARRHSEPRKRRRALGGPGPSGLRTDHVREALQSAHSDEVSAHLTAVCQVLARGEAPAIIAPHIAGAALHALPKKHGGVRPIAAGETLRRLVGKLMCRSVREEARDCLFPLQVGVGVKCGAEAAVHTARQGAERNDAEGDKVLVKVDFSNAFNTVQRAAVLREVRHHLPQLAPWADWCYGRAGVLRYGDHTILSTAGVQQGDPLGPLLFALALQPALEAAKAAAPLDLCFAYLDDVVLAGREDHVLRALQALTTAAAALGLVVQPSKCELVHAAGPFSYVDSARFPAGFLVRDLGNFDLLGAAISGHLLTVTGSLLRTRWRSLLSALLP